MKTYKIIIGIFCAITCIGCKNNHEGLQSNIVANNGLNQHCKYQNNNVELGIGIIIWNEDCEEDIQFYTDKKLNNKSFKINFCNQFNDVCPLFFKPDYGIMHFSVKSRNDFFYKIYVNNSETLFISTSGPFTFMSWDDFLINQTVAVREKNGKNNYKVKSVDNEIIIVVNEITKEQKQIQWKENDKLLIEILLLI